MRLNKEVFEKHVISYGPGRTIFKEKDPGDEMYVIIEGNVEIRKSTSASSSKTLVVLGKGDIFGEMAIIEQKKRSATAMAKDRIRLLVLNQQLFETTLTRNPDFARKMIKILSERLRRANAALQDSLITNRQNQIMAGLKQYVDEFGTATFKGKRFSIEKFLDWARNHIGIGEDEIKPVIKTFLKRGVLEPSARGGEEVVLIPRPNT